MIWISIVRDSWLFLKRYFIETMRYCIQFVTKLHFNWSKIRWCQCIRIHNCYVRRKTSNALVSKKNYPHFAGYDAGLVLSQPTDRTEKYRQKMKTIYRWIRPTSTNENKRNQFRNSCLQHYGKNVEWSNQRLWSVEV